MGPSGGLQAPAHIWRASPGPCSTWPHTLFAHHGFRACIKCQLLRVFRHEKRAQTQTFESGYFPVGRGLPCEGMRAKKFGMSLETREIKLYWQDISGFCWDVPAAPKSLRNKSLCLSFGPQISPLPGQLDKVDLAWTWESNRPPTPVLSI